MIFEQLKIGGDRNFGYLIADLETREAAIIDPGYSPEIFLDKIKDYNLKLIYIINTHSDFDHIDHNDTIKARTKASIAAHESFPFKPDIELKDNQELLLGKIKLKILHTPGHTYDSICILIENKLITGDTLFVGKIGGTSTLEEAKFQFSSLFRKLAVLPTTTEIYPGHDLGINPSSTIGEEFKNNPFLQQKTFEDFLYLKNNWLEYKQQHNIK